MADEAVAAKGYTFNMLQNRLNLTLENQSQSLLNEVVDFFAQSESFTLEVGELVDAMLSWLPAFFRRPINSTDDLRYLPNIGDNKLRALESKTCGILLLAVDVKADLVFAKAVKVLAQYDSYQQALSAQSVRNPYVLSIKKTSDGVYAGWRDSTSRTNTYLYRNVAGNFPRSDFKRVGPKVKDVICGSFGKALASLREQTTKIGEIRSAISTFLLLGEEYSKGLEIQESGFEELDSYWQKALDPQLHGMIYKVNQFDGKPVNSSSDTGFLKDLPAAQLQAWDDLVDKNITLLIRILRAVLLFRGINVVRYFYQQKQTFIEHNKTVSRTGIGKKIVINVFPKVRGTQNGIGAAWMKTKHKSPAYGKSSYKDSTHLKIKDWGYPASSFPRLSPEAKELVCMVVEPRLVILRRQTAQLADMKRLERRMRYLCESFYKREVK